MKKWILILFLLPNFAFAQTDSKNLFDSIQFIEKVPHCLDAIWEQLDSNTIFWRIVNLKENAIPNLIDKIDDTTTTSAEVRHFGGYYAVGDIAFKALEEIIHGIPTFKLLNSKFDKDGCGYCAYWNLLRADIKYRKKFKKNLQKWYSKNKNKLVWTPYKWQGEECFYKNPNNGYYELKK